MKRIRSWLYIAVMLASNGYACGLPTNAVTLVAERLAPKGSRVDVSLSEAKPAHLKSDKHDSSKTYCAAEYSAFPFNKDGHPIFAVYSGYAVFDQQGKLVQLANDEELEWPDGKPKPRSP